MDDHCPPWEGAPDTPDRGGLDAEDAFGEHDIEYWVWSGHRLVPASPEQVALLRADEEQRLLVDERRREAEASPGRRPAARWAAPLDRLLTRTAPVAGLFRATRRRRAAGASPPASAPDGDGRPAVEGHR